MCVKGLVKSWVHRLEVLSPPPFLLPSQLLGLSPMSSQGHQAVQTILRVTVTFAENCPF